MRKFSGPLLILAANGVGVALRDWTLLLAVDGAALGMFLLFAFVSRVWPDKGDQRR